MKSRVYGALEKGNTKGKAVRASAYRGIPRLFNAMNIEREVLSGQ